LQVHAQPGFLDQHCDFVYALADVDQDLVDLVDGK
jgi:hypothetical protein